MRSEFYLIRKEKQKAQFFFWSKSYVNLAMKSLLIYIQRLILQLNRLHVYTSSKIWGSYQTLSPVRRTFVFLDSRCVQPLTPMMRMLSVTNFQNGGQAKEGNKKTKRFCNEYSIYIPR